MSSPPIAFIGGGNMARAIIAGLIRSGHTPSSLQVVEPLAAQREALQTEWGVSCQAQPDATLSAARLVVWAVKPQSFREAAAACRDHVQGALQLSVMAGIRSDALVSLLGTERVVRAMPNTPALIGQGVSGVFARPAVTPPERAQVEALLTSTGATLWLDQESDLDAVTALSGSGPAYVFYVIEALVEAAQSFGLSEAQGRQLVLSTFEGATALALASPDSPAELRQRVTSKGGTTHAALTHLEQRGVKAAFIEAAQAACQRAKQMGEEFGA
ncbi:MAG: pyrroline-5-carboxylate reductase [Pseudomonadota bacterium]